jgi:indole-3-acetate monooxygenase
MTTQQLPVDNTATAALLEEQPANSDVAASLIEAVHRIGPFIREHSESAEKNRRLPRPVFDALASAGLQRMLMPRSLGGLEVDPVTCARVVEALASYDSAAAWSLQSGNVNAYWSCILPEEGVEEIYGSSPSVMVAAGFHPPQHAREVPGGFRVSGRAPLASTIHDCEWVLFGALIMEENGPRMTPFGPAMIAFIVKTSEVNIIDTWHTLGMRGTDSNDAEFSDLFVPAHRTFPMTPGLKPGRHFQGPLYRFPAVPIVALFSVGVLTAAARGAITELKELAGKKTPFGTMKMMRDRATVQTTLAEAEGILRSARALFYQTLSDAWARTVAGEKHSLEHRADLLLACAHAAKESVRVTDMMHKLAGTTGIYNRSKLDRYLRDSLTLRNHGFVSESKLESVGQVYLGLQPDFPLLVF